MENSRFIHEPKMQLAGVKRGERGVWRQQREPPRSCQQYEEKDHGGSITGLPLRVALLFGRYVSSPQVLMKMDVHASEADSAAKKVC